MRIEVLDDDLVGNDLLGYLNVDLHECLENQQKWINRSGISLDGSQEMRKKYARVDKDLGKIYF